MPNPEPADWQPLAPDDPLFAPPTVTAPPLADPTPIHLNTHDLSWEAVENLVVALARQVDSVHEIRRYGRPGQAQHGIDVVGFPDGSAPSVYQSKRWETFTATDLENAVTKYADGPRPFGATRIVVITTADASDTHVVEKLHTLRERYRPLLIDLWDRDTLSEMLRNRPEVVVRFFGDATAAAFCGGLARRERLRPNFDRIAADAIVRGPIAHLGFGQILADAEKRRTTEPLAAAEGFAQVAAALEDSPFTLHAREMRSRQAVALRAAGRPQEALPLDLRLLAEAMEGDHPFEALMVARRITEGRFLGTEDDKRAVATITAIAAYRHRHDVSLDVVADAFDTTCETTPYRLVCAVVLAEHAVAARRLDLIRARADVLSKGASRAPRDDLGLLLSARLRACVADATGVWSGLAYTARTEFPSRVTALLLARHARFLANSGNAEAAVFNYYSAVEYACQAGTYGDAANWLFALRAVRVLAGELREDINDLYRLAQALRTRGSDSVMPSAFSARAFALAQLHSDNDPDALEALVRYRWRAVALGSVTEEMEANELIGRVFARTGNIDRAIESWIAAGAAKPLRALAERLPPGLLHLPVPGDLSDRPSWVRASAFSIAGSASDRLSDSDASSWARAALAEVERPNLPNDREARQSAFRALASLSDAMTLDEGRRILTLMEPLVDREPAHYRSTDDAHVEILIQVARTHADLRQLAVRQMCRAICVADVMGDRMLERGQVVLREERDTVVEICAERAVSGNPRAALALAVVGDVSPTVLETARQSVMRTIGIRTHAGGSRSYMGGWGREAYLASRLEMGERLRFAEAMATIAADSGDVSHNRELALDALRAIGPHLDDASRDRYFELAVSGAKGALEPSADSGSAVPNPLDRFRVNLNSGDLRSPGLFAAALLARTSEHQAEVAHVGIQMLGQAGESEQREIAAALSRLPPTTLQPYAPGLEHHHSPSVRALAAYLWCASGGVPPELGRKLATDPSETVRVTLAREMTLEPTFAALREVLRSDWCRTVRRLARG